MILLNFVCRNDPEILLQNSFIRSKWVCQGNVSTSQIRYSFDITTLKLNLSDRNLTMFIKVSGRLYLVELCRAVQAFTCRVVRPVPTSCGQGPRRVNQKYGTHFIVYHATLHFQFSPSETSVADVRNLNFTPYGRL